MKTQLSAFAVTALIFSAAYSYTGETAVDKATLVLSKQETQNSSISFFRAHRQGKRGVTATWGMNSSSGVAGFSVQRTYEDPTDPYANWETISTQPCNGARSYKCTEQEVQPGYLNYRLMVRMSDGSEISSEVVTVHIISH